MLQVLQAKTVNKWYRGNHAVISVHYNNLNASVLFYISFPFYQHTFFISSLFYLTNLSICVSLSLCYHFLLWLKERKKVFNLCCKSILTTKQSTSCRAKLAPEKCFLFAAQKHFKRKFCIWIFVRQETRFWEVYEFESRQWALDDYYSHLIKPTTDWKYSFVHLYRHATSHGKRFTSLDQNLKICIENARHVTSTNRLTYQYSEFRPRNNKTNRLNFCCETLMSIKFFLR